METTRYRVYPYRWVVLAVYGLSAAVIQLMWATFFSVTATAWKFYGFTDPVSGGSAMNLLSVLFMVGMVILSIPSMAIFERFGFKKSVGFGVVLAGICGMTRGIWGDNYVVVFLSTVGLAVGHPFILNAPGLVASRWFPESEQATANSVGMLSNYLGICSALLVTPLLLEHGMGIKGMLMAYGVVGAVTAVLFLALVRERPRTPPCPEENTARDSFGDGIKSALKKRNFVLILVAFLFLAGIFNMFFTMIEQILGDCSDHALSSTQVGAIGVIILVSGIAGSLVLSIVSDRDRRRRRLPYAIAANVVGAVGLALFIFTRSFAAIAVAAVLYGVFATGSSPLLMTFAAEEAYPTSEGTSEGLMMFVGNVAGTVFVAGAGLFGGNYKLLMVVAVAISVACLVPLAVARESKLASPGPKPHGVPRRAD